VSDPHDERNPPPPAGGLSPDDEETTAIEGISASGTGGEVGSPGPEGAGERAAGEGVVDEGAADERAGAEGVGSSRAGSEAAGSEGGGGDAAGLEPGDVLAGRFHIVRRLGQGGMGEVYEAQDKELGEPVAVKILRSQIASDPSILARFRREIQLARKVTHPNICRLYDLRYHRPEVDGGPRRPITFLTMELLRGETLARRVRREGRLIPIEALPLARQVADGLAAAHRAGVVHRDLKTSNVMLVATPEGTRAVITDFGLARAADPGAAGASLTGTQLIVGSPSYMAPEQVAGEPVGPAADLYSLGIVLYEMVTGALPYTGDSVISIAIKRLHEPPPSPREKAPDLPPHWEATILRCLARRPEGRFAHPLEVVAALESGKAGAGTAPAAAPGVARPPSPRALARRLRGLPVPRWAVGVAVGVGLAVLVLLGVLLGRILGGAGGAGPPPPVKVGDRPAMAVLALRNLSGGEDVGWLAEVLADALTTDLGTGRELLLVPRETVARVQAELALSPGAALTAATLAKLRSLLGVQYVIVGDYLAAGGNSVEVNLNLQEAATGVLRQTFRGEGTTAEFWQLANTLADRVRTELGIATTRGAVARLASAEATRLYAEGLVCLRGFDPGGARDRLRQAVAADSSSPRAWSALATALRDLGYETEAEEAARKALDLARELPWEDRQLLEGRYREAARQWPEAIVAYENLWSIFSDNVEYGLLLASAQTAAGEGSRALGTVEELRTLPAPANEDPRIDLAEAEAARSLSDYDRQLAAAGRAVEKGQGLGARLLVARGRRLEGEVQENRGDFAAAADAYREATRLYADAGDRVGEARTLHNMAITLARQGDLSRAESLLTEVLATYRGVGAGADEARALSNLGTIARGTRGLEEAERLYEEALARSREIRDRRGEARELTNLGIVYKAKDELDRATGRYREALDVWRQIGDRANMATAMNNLANVLREQDQPTEARPLFEGCLEIFEELGDRASAAGVLSNLGEIDAEEGKLDAAEELHQRSLAVYREIGARPQEALELRLLAQLASRRGDVETTAERYGQALAIWDDTGARFPATTARLELAEIFFQAGRVAEAQAAAQEVLDGIPETAAQSPPARSLAAQALAIRTLVALSTGDLPAAREALAAARKQAQGLPPEVALWVEIAGARVRAAGSDGAGARRSLEALLAAHEGEEALRPHCREARLALGELELAAGLTEAGRARLTEVEAAARADGDELFARRAAAVRGKG